MTRTTGILADKAIKALFDAGKLKSEAALDHDQIQPASLDLRLGARRSASAPASCPARITSSPTSSTG